MNKRGKTSKRLFGGREATTGNTSALRRLTPATRSSDFVNHSFDYRPNWTPLSPVTITNCIILRSVEGLTSFNRNKFTSFCGEKKSTMKLSSVSIFREYARVKCPPRLSSSKLKPRLSLSRAPFILAPITFWKRLLRRLSLSFVNCPQPRTISMFCFLIADHVMLPQRTISLKCRSW